MLNNIEHITEKKCYLCGRTPEEFIAILKAGSLKNQINQAIHLRNQQIEQQVNKYLNEFKQLSQDVEQYPGNVTLSELRNNPQLSIKIAPKYQELAKFAPEQDKNERNGNNREIDYTIDTLRKNLNQKILEFEQKKYENFTAGFPYLREVVKSIATPIINDLIPKNVKFTECKTEKGFDLDAPNQEIHVNIRYFLCPICSELFSVASNAAFYVK
jgi:hypothetical protein